MKKKMILVLMDVLGIALAFTAVRLYFYPEKKAPVQKENMQKAAGNMETMKEKEIETKNFIIDMEGLSQEGIPTGCESVSTVSVLNYMGVPVSVDEFINTYLPMKEFRHEGGKTIGGHPEEAFLGDPYSDASLGCYSTAIATACENMKKDGYCGMEEVMVLNIKGAKLSSLAETYLENGIPVVVWVTMEMEESYEGFTYYLENGEEYVWTAREHCMVLVGEDSLYYYLKDPLKNGETVCYSKELVNQRYNEMGKQAVVLHNTR